jgi:hypothetical protein
MTVVPEWGSIEALTQLPVAGPAPSRCPYCPATTVPHWTGWGSYQRGAPTAAVPQRKIAVQRWWCKVVRRTFSLLPAALLPHHSWPTGQLLSWLSGRYQQGLGANTLARQWRLPRSTVRGVLRRFARVMPRLRLPGQEGALSAAAFLTSLAAMPLAALVACFQQWKEGEPKQAVVGIYCR